MSTSDSNSHVFEPAAAQADVSQQIRDISEVPAIEVITTAAVHLMSAAAVKLGLAAEENAQELKDLDEARSELDQTQEHLAQFGDKLPKEIRTQFEALRERLS